MAALIIGIVMGIEGAWNLTDLIIKRVGKGDAPSIKAFVVESQASTNWPDSGDFTLNQGVGLNQSLQMPGALV